MGQQKNNSRDAMMFTHIYFYMTDLRFLWRYTYCYHLVNNKIIHRPIFCQPIIIWGPKQIKNT